MAETKKLEFTQREAEIMAASFQALKTAPEYDYHKLADLLKMTNHNSAANAIRAVRRKIDSYKSTDGTTPVATSTPKRRGKGAAATNGSTKAQPDGDAANENETDDAKSAAAPKKRGKVSKAKAKVPVEEEVDNGERGGKGSDGEGGGEGDAGPGAPASPNTKRKVANLDGGSPKKRGRRAVSKIKSEEVVKEEEGQGEGSSGDEAKNEESNNGGLGDAGEDGKESNEMNDDDDAITVKREVNNTEED